MTQSLNEIEALAKKAARGAGHSWGLAEEAGKAVRWLSAFGPDGPRALADALDRADAQGAIGHGPMALGPAWIGAQGWLCPVTTGASLTDIADLLANGAQPVLNMVAQPILTVPFAAWAAGYLGAPVVLEWPGGQVVTDGTAVSGLDGLAQLDSATLTVRCADAATDLIAPGRRGHLDPETQDRLMAFASRTYAPATEESRALGAGAGNSDND